MSIEFIPASSYYNDLNVIRYKNTTFGTQYYMCFINKLFVNVQSYNDLIHKSDYVIMINTYPDKDYTFIVTDPDICDDVMIWCDKNLQEEWDDIPFDVKKSRYMLFCSGFVVSTNDITDAMAIKLRWL